MTRALGPVAALMAIGAVWGLTMPFTRIAVTGGDYRPLGMIFWQQAIGAAILCSLCVTTGRRLSLAPAHLRVYLVIAFIGTIFPNMATYRAAAELPAGIMSIVVSTVPLLAFPIAILWGTDRFSALRLVGLMLGLAAIALIALPETSLPDPAMAAWLPLALLPSCFYALEGNVVARYGTAGLDPVEVLAGASVVGVVLVGPAALLAGSFISPIRPWGQPELAILGIGLAHAGAYTGYVWLVGRAGAVFAAQVAYLVTGFGVLWSMLILAERYSAWIWAALVLMLAGVFLVQPRPRAEHAT